MGSCCYCVLVFFMSYCSIVTYADYNLHVLHVNDIHARFEQTNEYSGRCSPQKAGTYILEALGSSRIQPTQWFLDRSCQNELMRSNIFFKTTFQLVLWVRSSGWKLLLLLPNFKNSFVRSSGKNTLIFGTYNILVPVIFWSIF